MKKAILLFAISSIAFSCKKKEDNPQPVLQPQPAPVVQPTTVEVKVIDEIGNSMPNATVTLIKQTFSVALFSNDTTFEYTTIASGKTNDRGVFKTTTDANIKIYYTIEAGECLEQSSSTFIGNTTPNVNNIVTVVMKNTAGTLKIVNNNDDPFYIYKDGTLWFTAEAGMNYTYKLKNGTYSIRALQKSGYLVNPTDATVSKTVSCGTETITTIN